MQNVIDAVLVGIVAGFVPLLMCFHFRFRSTSSSKILAHVLENMVPRPFRVKEIIATYLVILVVMEYAYFVFLK